MTCQIINLPGVANYVNNAMVTLSIVESLKRLKKTHIFLCYQGNPPVRARGVKSRMCPPYPQRDRNLRRLNVAMCRNHWWSCVGARTGTLKKPTKCLWRWEPDRRSNFFFSPPAHLCAVTYMTEISLIVTLNNQFTHSPRYQGLLSQIKEIVF